MSARATFWAWKAGSAFELNSTERLVLLKLADGASSETGQCWYKQATLATATGLSRSGVQKALYSLANHGLVTIEGRSVEGRTAANDYRVNLDIELPVPTRKAAVPLSPAVPTAEAGGAYQEGSYSESSSGDPSSEKRVSGKAKAKKARAIPAIPIPDPPPEIDSPGLRAFLPEFAEYRRKVKRSPLDTEDAWTYLFNRLKSAGREHAVLALRLAMVRKWLSFHIDWLKGASWEQVASELGLSLRKEEARVDPAAELEAARKHALVAARDSYETVVKALTPNEDGWTLSARTWLFDGLEALQSPEEFEARLTHAQALIVRLRVLGALPLAPRPKDAPTGLIFPACGGGPWRPKLEGSEGWSIDVGQYVGSPLAMAQAAHAADLRGRPAQGLAVPRLDSGRAFELVTGWPRPGIDKSEATCPLGEDPNGADGYDMIGDDLSTEELRAEWPVYGAFDKLVNPPLDFIDDPVPPTEPSPEQVAKTYAEHLEWQKRHNRSEP